MLGSLIDGKYKVLRLLGEGGMGAVYEAVHTGTHRRVALKVILDFSATETEVLARFQREAIASGTIASPHIVQVLDTGTDRETGNPYLVMELLEGEDLARLEERLGPLEPGLAMRIAMQACLALQKAHDVGVVHRDVKPGNIFIARQDMGEIIVKVLDFGIAKFKKDPMSAADVKLTRTGNLLGSPLYMPPEQVRATGQIDGRSDVYSLGVVMYETLAGAAPWANMNSLGDLILAICGRQAPHLQDRAPWVSSELAEIVHTAIQVHPERRFQRMSDMFQALHRLSPQGWSVRAEDLRGMSIPDRGVVASRFERTNEDVPLPSDHTSSQRLPIPGQSNRALSESISAVSSGAAGKRPGLAPAVRAGLAVFGGAAVIGLAGIGVWVAKGSGQPGAAGAPSGAASQAAAAPAPASPGGGASPASPVARSVVVTIEPKTAKARVDGVEVSVSDGKIVVEGALGSVHTIVLDDAGKQHTAQVAIAEAGAVPNVVVLASATHLRPTGSATVAAPTSTGKRPSVATTKPAGGSDTHVPGTGIQTGTDEFK